MMKPIKKKLFDKLGTKGWLCQIENTDLGYAIMCENHNQELEEKGIYPSISIFEHEIRALDLNCKTEGKRTICKFKKN